MPAPAHATFSVSGKHRRQAPLASYAQPSVAVGHSRGGDSGDCENGGEAGSGRAAPNPFGAAPRTTVRVASKAAAAQAEAELAAAQGRFNRQISQSKFSRNIARQ
jgi:hypothetical protein